MRLTRPTPGIARARRAARRELTLGLVVLAVLGLAAWLSTVALSGLPWSHPYQVRLALSPGSPLLHSGDEVRIGGERRGQVQSVELAPGSRSRAIATLELDGARIGAGASARARPLGMAGAVYVDLSPGRASAPLRSGSLIAATGSVELTDVIAGFDATAQRALRQTMTGYGTGFAGRGGDVNQVLAAAPSLLTNLTATLDALRPRPGDLSAATGDASTVAGAVAPPSDDTLARVVQSARVVLGTTGAHASALAATIGTLPSVERYSASVAPGAEGLLKQASTAATKLTPGVTALVQALPRISALERQRPAIDLFASVARAAAPTLHALTPALSKLTGPASGLTPLSTPIAELAGVLIPYRTELVQAPLGFTRWGNFTYDFGTGKGHRAVRFSMVLTCALARDPYPAPGAAAKERKSCP